MTIRSRDDHQSFNMLTQDRRALDVPGVLAGQPGVVLSGDPRSEALSLLVELAPGTTLQARDELATLELFVLQGDVSLEGQRVGASGFVQLPQGGGGGELASERGAVVVAFWNPSMPAFPPPYSRPSAVRSHELPWHATIPGSHGVLHRCLRQPDMTTEAFDGGPGGFVRMLVLAPGIADHQQHIHHECWEEVITLSGDVLMADEGWTGRGSVLSHPQEYWHGPFASHSGAVLLVHTDAPMGVPPWPQRPYPHGEQLVGDYLDDYSWITPREHESWDEARESAIRDTPEFKAWTGEPGWSMWSEEVGRGTASRARAAWRHDPPPA